MSIDRDSYEPISGNPRRETGQAEDLAEEGESGSSESTSSSPKSKDGDPSGPNGNPKSTDGAPKVPNRDPTGTQTSPGDQDGDPSGPTGALADTDGDPIGGEASSPESEEVRVFRRGETEETESSSGGHPQTGDRKRRVKVTPNDWETLEKVSNQIGVGYATVYRIAFRQFIQGPED